MMNANCTSSPQTEHRGLILLPLPHDGPAAAASLPDGNWQAPRPRRVLLGDGEMPASALRERLHGLAAAGGQAPDLLEVLAGDLIDGGIGNLAVGEVQAEVETLLDGVDLLILDNLASLT